MYERRMAITTAKEPHPSAANAPHAGVSIRSRQRVGCEKVEPSSPGHDDKSLRW
jgi:hypothetical protein